jgi:hypothetical protein
MKNPFRTPPSQSTTKITINGKTMVVQGSNVTVKNGVVQVDGVTIQTGLQGDVKILWEGPLASVTADGSIECGDVHGNVEGGNGVHCKNVQGNVRAGNSVNCGNIGGNCHAGNSVNRR